MVFAVGNSYKFGPLAEDLNFSAHASTGSPCSRARTFYCMTARVIGENTYMFVGLLLCRHPINRVCAPKSNLCGWECIPL